MNMRSVVFGLVSAAAMVAETPSPTSFPSTLQNGSFGEGELGQMPKGWKIPKPISDSGFHGALVEDTSLVGGRAILFSREPGNAPMGHLGQTISAKLFQGKRIRLKSMLRLEAPSHSGAMLLLSVNRRSGKNSFTDNMMFRPVTQPTWTAAEIIGDVVPDAETISIGAILRTNHGKMWIAPFTLEVLGDTPGIHVEGPKPLTSQGLQNLVAFTKAFNYVRFFHPSDEAAAANWNRLAIKGVRTVEGATSTLELARRLRTFFAPYVPGVQFLVDGKKAKPVPQPSKGTQIVRWEHAGFWNKDPYAPYRSQREYIPLKRWKGETWGDPYAASKFSLTKGLSIGLPTLCFADDTKATLPQSNIVRPPDEELPEPTSESTLTGDDRATRLGDIGLAWGVFQHFYPYFDAARVDWDAELAKALRSAATDTDSRAFGHTLRRMVAALKDGHGLVSGEGALGQYAPSLGIRMVGGEPVVGFSTGSSKVVKPGSRILSVDDDPIAARVARLKEEISAATQGWMNTQLGEQLLSGEQGSTAKLRIKSPSGQEEEISLLRDTHTTMVKDIRLPAPLAELRPGLWYVDLDRITGKAFKDALPQLSEAKGVVFDLRGYPRISPHILGHLADQPMKWITGGVPIVTRPDRAGWTFKAPEKSETFDIAPAQPRLKGRVVFLTGGGTISLPEAWMEVVEANKLGEIVGEPTGGTNGAINRFDLPGDYTIRFTGAKVTKMDGRRHHGVGIHPTVPVSPTLKGITEGIDEVLDRGLEVVSR